MLSRPLDEARLAQRGRGLVRSPGNGRIRVHTRFDPCRGDEIGKHSGLKIRRLTACRFKSGPRHQEVFHPIAEKSLNPRRSNASGVFCFRINLGDPLTSAARDQRAAGIDPRDANKADKRAARLNTNNSFETVARDWLEERKSVVQIGQN